MTLMKKPFPVFVGTRCESKCEDEETLKKYIQSGDVLFDYDDITDGGDFELCDIEEMSFVNS